MTNKTNKKIIISGVLFTIMPICYTLYQALTYSYITGFYGVEIFSFSWENTIFTAFCSVVLILYCFALHKTKIGNKFYLFGLSAFALLNIYYLLSTDGRFDLYVVSDILFLTITIFMIIAKIKNNKAFSVSGTVIFIVYAFTQFITVVSDTTIIYHFTVCLFFSAYLIAKFFAFFNLWLVGCSNFTLTNKHCSLTEASLENKLTALKLQFESGIISEEEFNRRKIEILNKL